MLKIKKGDKVKVLIGKDKGKEGQVEKVFGKKSEVLVSGVNIYKKHAKARQGKQGGIIDLVKPLAISKVSLVCPKCGKAARVGFSGTEEKVRICRKCKETI